MKFLKLNLLLTVVALLLTNGVKAQEIPSADRIINLATQAIKNSDTASLKLQLRQLERSNSSADDVHVFFETYKQQIDKAMGTGYAIAMQRAAINRQYFSTLGTGSAAPDWVQLRTKLFSMYGTIAEQPLLIARVNYASAQKAYQDLIPATEELMKNYPGLVSGFTLNNFAFDIFKVETDNKMLQTALVWSAQSLKEEPNSPHYLDTYANLLHKLGQTKQAITYEERAYSLADEKQKAEILPFLEKMKAGEKTW